MKSLFTVLLLLILPVSLAFAQKSTRVFSEPAEPMTQTNFFNTAMDYQVRAFFSIGGSAPLGFPREIRKIVSYNPKLQLGLAVNATKWLHRERLWGIRVGLKVEGKGMATKAQVKNYHTRITQDHSKVEGFFTGQVNTEVKNVYVTLPVSLVYRFSSRWQFYGGFYASVLIDKEFRGRVSNGYLREGTPVGPKLTFEEGSGAPYDFSKKVTSFQWGVQLGAEWNLRGHFILFPEITYGINSLLDKDFSALSFSLHNIYLNLGFGYQF